MNRLTKRSVGLLVAGAGLTGIAYAQQTIAEPEKGKVIFSTDQAHPVTPTANEDVFPKPLITNTERAAVIIESDVLDLHLTPADAGEAAHATLTLRNISAAPLTRIPMQISSTLRWQSITSSQPLTFTQSPVTTDEDHTGYAQEAVLLPAHPLAPGKTMTVSVFYTGQIPVSTARLDLIGTPPEKASETDWDAITQTSDAGSTALRGFGDVIWYPVAAPTAVFGEGNELFAQVARQRSLNLTATMQLRLTVEYAGDPPDGAIFNGQLEPLERTPDDANQVVDETHGVATADFPLAPLGFRTPNLFLTAQQPAQSDSQLVSVLSPDADAILPYATAVEALAPMFHDWFAPAPLTPLLLLDHPGSPFEDHAFIVGHLSANAPPEGIEPELVRGLTHAFFRAPAPTSLWLDQGLPEFMSLLWTERTSGHDAAIRQLEQNALTLALAEPDFVKNPTLAGTPLTSASSDVYVRLKSGAVLWQLRELLGPDLFRLALINFRQALMLSPGLDKDPKAFEHVIEKTASRDLGWFFEDWVYHDRGLPDLTIASVDARPILPRAGESEGYLVAVNVRNEGAAVADVPVTVSAGDVKATARLRIPGGTTAAVRIIFGTTPESVQVNDGSVPEVRNSVHTSTVHIQETR